MRKVLILQHMAHEILGTLNPYLKQKGLNVRYVNFDRTPEEQPNIDKYNGLVILGGPMGVYEANEYPHLKWEMQMIERALKKDMPILGICLGSQLLAQVLGSQVRQHHEKEIGWYDVKLTEDGKKDKLFEHFGEQQKVFQIHGDTYDMPKTATHLAYGDSCESQAFKYGDKAYGLQFHLEVDKAMIYRWLEKPNNQKDIQSSNGKFSFGTIKSETEKYIDNSVQMSHKTFANFVDLFELKDRPILLGSDHAKNITKK